MLVGYKNKFAIQLEVLDVIDGWVFGSFVFWIADTIVGNPEDKTVDLQGCVNWLTDFINNPCNRFEPGLYSMDKEQIFLLLCSSVISTDQRTTLVKEQYENIFSRFHISHLGMSSFDKLNILLIENEAKECRCIWQQDNQEIKDAFLKTGEFEKVALEVIHQFVTCKAQ
jgi:Immunity protein 42